MSAALIICISIGFMLAATLIFILWKQSFSDKLNDKFLFMSKELREELEKNTRILESKFSQIETKVTDRLTGVQKEGFVHFQKVQEILSSAEKQLSNLNLLGQSVQALHQVLSLPHLRGKIIGEGTLEKLLSDFLPPGFYDFQYLLEGHLVDAVIKFPHLNLVLPIDSKFSLEQVAPLFEKTTIDTEGLKTARKKLAELTKKNARDIQTKYIKPKLGTTDFALMYLPSETLYFEVIHDSELWEALVQFKVFPVSPHTFAITVFSIGKSLQYYEMAKGVQKTLQQIQGAQDHFENFKKRYEDIGDKLSRAQESFQKASTHLTYYTSSVHRLAPESKPPESSLSV